MTHNIIETIIDNLNSQLKAENIVVRDFTLDYGIVDSSLRIKRNHVGTDKFIVDGGMSTTFAISGKNARCKCSWKSAHCSFQFHYDIFQAPKSSKGVHKHYVYLEAVIFL